MDEYIKRDDVVKIIDNYSKTVTDEGKVVVDAIRDIVAVITPATDVVPKAEYEAAIIDRNAARLGMIAEHERLQMARAETVREFAKYLIDHASGGVINAFDLPDLVIDFVKGATK